MGGSEIPLIGKLSLVKKNDSYPLKEELNHLVRFLSFYREELKPVDPFEFVSIFAFEGRYAAEDVHALEKHYLLRIPRGEPRNVGRLHRQFFEAVLPFARRAFQTERYSKTRGTMVELLTLVILKIDREGEGYNSVILFVDNKTLGKALSQDHEELDVIVMPENNEAAIGECKSDGSAYYGQESLIRWYELAAESMVQEGLRAVHIFAVCATNRDVMEKHLTNMVAKRPWWTFSIPTYKRPQKIGGPSERV